MPKLKSFAQPRRPRAHPERVSAIVVQNGNAYEEGLKAFWDPIKAYWADGSEARRQAIANLVAPKTTKFQYTDGVKDVWRIDPDNWGHDQPLLDRPGNKDIQLDLFKDYGTNVPLYPAFQAYFRKYQPPTLIIWGKNDRIFPADGAVPYKRDLPNAEYHMLDTGHFVLEGQFDVAEPLIHDFLDRQQGSATTHAWAGVLSGCGSNCYWATSWRASGAYALSAPTRYRNTKRS